MVKQRFLRFALLAGLLFLLAGFASPEEQIKRISENFGFIGPEIFKIGERSNNLQTGDFDADGKCDFLVLNQSERKIFVYYQVDELNKKFQQYSIPFEKNIVTIAAADIDGDRKIDVLFTDSDNKLNVAYHEKDKQSFAPPEQIDLDIKEGALKVADINNDGRVEIVIVNEDAINIFSCGVNRAFSKPKKIDNTFKSTNYYIADVDGDGLKDLVFVNPSAQMVSFRRQEKDGSFAAGISQKLENINVGEFVDVDGDRKDELLGLHSTTNALKIYRFTPAGELKPDPKKKFRLSQLRNCQFKTGSNSYKDLSIGDVNGDFLTDIVYVDSAKAEINLLLGDKSGGFPATQVFPSFVGTRGIAIADINSDQKNEVLVLSTQEKSIGVSQMTAEGRLSFPKTIPVDLVPTALATGDIDLDKKTDLVFGARDEKAEKGFVVMMCQDKKGNLGAPKKIELSPKQGTVIEAIKVADVNNDNLPDLVVFFEISSPIVFLQQKDGSFKDVTTSDPFLSGIFNKLGPAQITLGAFNQNEPQKVLISRRNFTRSLSWQPAVKPEIADQYNGKAPESEIQTTVIMDIDGDNSPEIILYDSQFKTLTILKKGEQQLYEIAENVDVGYFTAKEIFAEDLNGDGVKDLLIFGQERFGIIYVNVVDPQFELRTEYATEIKKGFYTKFTAGDVNNDGEKDVIVLETRRHNMEILSVDDKGKLKQELTFKVFEDPEVDMLDEEMDDWRWRQLPLGEPREIKIADMNGDKKMDIILLSHRNMLIYFQE